ncbi:NADH dehydrogenase [Aeropyrum pernix K1]|uniref:NADH dehydrogenase n=1 Tax=Aeropyrum pernix (strain ATCC 700893 / DSM 11879 / JCM 9820 / NBRC 100138 / K1) TaxID=272557 RepID=Q9YD68_AERPE|nr:nitroreductase family protein [Aeropyrum pernix]BAA80029.1 NADH dehydrogenase [Aeropyrum pernix K1]
MEATGASEAARVVYEVFARHRSIRKYVKKPLPEEHVSLLLEAARRAPTDATLHLWSAVRVVDDGVRRRIADAIGQEHVYEAGEFFIFLADFYRLKRLLEYRGEELGRVDRALLVFAAIDAGLAAENMAVMAEALGYGTCFIGGVQNAAELIIELLALPEKTYPLFGLTIGYPAEDPPLRPRLPPDLLFHTDRYREYTSEDLARAYEAMASYSRRRDWLRILKRYVAKGGYFEARSEEMWRLLRKQGFSL